MKSYFGDEQQITILNLDTYKKIVQEDCRKMEKERLTEQKYQSIGKEEVLEAYELWLQDTLIDLNFENAWISLMGKQANPSFRELEMIFMKMSDIQMRENAGYTLSDEQQSLLDKYYCCFPFGRRDLLTIVKQFFTRFHVYYQNIGLDDKDLTSLQKIQLASGWRVEQKLQNGVSTTKNDVVVAYNNWLGSVPFEGLIDRAWQELVRMSQPKKVRYLGNYYGDLFFIKRKANMLFEMASFQEFNNDDKAFAIYYWLCFHGNNDEERSEKAKQFFQIYLRYCEDEGLNPYGSSLKQIKDARVWRDEIAFEKAREQERKRIKCT